MELELYINGEKADYSLEGSEANWGAFHAALSASLAEQGWVIKEACLDGKLMETGREELIDLGSGKHKVEIQAEPTQDLYETLTRKMETTLPTLLKQTQELGEKFGRGEWRDGLASTNSFIENLGQVLVGAHALANLRGEDTPPAVDEVSKVLNRFHSHLAKQAWVEVGDLFLHELKPVLQRLNGYLEQGPAS